MQGQDMSGEISLFPHMIKETRELFKVSFIRAPILSLGLHSPDLIISQKPPHFNTITLGIRRQFMNLGEKTSIQSAALLLILLLFLWF